MPRFPESLFPSPGCHQTPDGSSRFARACEERIKCLLNRPEPRFCAEQRFLLSRFPHTPLGHGHNPRAGHGSRTRLFTLQFPFLPGNDSSRGPCQAVFWKRAPQKAHAGGRGISLPRPPSAPHSHRWEILLPSPAEGSGMQPASLRTHLWGHGDRSLPGEHGRIPPDPLSLKTAGKTAERLPGVIGRQRRD